MAGLDDHVRGRDPAVDEPLGVQGRELHLERLVAPVVEDDDGAALASADHDLGPDVHPHRFPRLDVESHLVDRAVRCVDVRADLDDEGVLA